MIYVITYGAGSVALVVPVRPMHAATAAEYAADGETVLKPGTPAETQEEYEADIIAGALAGFAPEDNAQHVATLDEAEVSALLAGPNIDTDDNDALQIGTSPRAYRDALTWDGAALRAPAARRRAVLIEKLRAKRNRALQRSDALIVRATEQGDTAAADALRAYRQALRDLPKTWDGNPATLASVWPTRPQL